MLSRYHVAVTAMALTLCASAATAQISSASPPGARRAYSAAMQCFVANGHVHTAFEKAGDTANARLFEAKAKTAFELAHYYGKMLHLNQQQVGRDIDAVADVELPKLLRDGSYLTVVAGTCKSQGLM